MNFLCESLAFVLNSNYKLQNFALLLIGHKYAHRKSGAFSLDMSIESFALLCLLFAELRTPFSRFRQNFKQSWTTLNFTCYVSLDQGSTVYPPPPPPKKKKKKQQQIGNPQKISLFYTLNLKKTCKCIKMNPKISLVL